MSHLFDRDFDGGLPRFDFDGYTLVDAMLSYDADRLGRFTVAVSNLFDEQYISYFSQTATFVTDRDFVSGRGRAFTLRWQGSRSEEHTSELQYLMRSTYAVSC